MTFEYLQRVIVDAELEVPDIGECCIQARNDLGEEWYLLIRSDMGFVDLIEYGPAHPDFNVLPNSVSLTYDHFEYSVFKLEKRIDKFLNNSKRMITQASVTEVDDIRKFIVNPVDKIFPEEPGLIANLVLEDDKDE